MPTANKLVIQQHDPVDIAPIVDKLDELVNKLGDIVRSIDTKGQSSTDSSDKSSTTTSDTSSEEIVQAIKSLNPNIDKPLQVAATIFTNLADKDRLNDEKYYRDVANKAVRLGKILVDVFNSRK
jgi:hypothetical protein